MAINISVDLTSSPLPQCHGGTARKSLAHTVTEPESPTEALVEAIGNDIIVEWETIDIRAGVIVGARGHADKERVGVADVLMRVKNIRRNHHQIAMLFTAVDFIHHPVRRRVLARVVENDLDCALAEKDAVVVLMMKVPAFDFAGTNRELINVSERRGMNAPRRIQNFAQRAAFVRLRHCRTDDHTVNHRCNRFAFRRDGLNVLA